MGGDDGGVVRVVGGDGDGVVMVVGGDGVVGLLLG